MLSLYMRSIKRAIGHALSDSRGVKELYGVGIAGWLAYSTRVPFGTNIYEREWDALIVLDACRVDTLQAVADEYEFLDTVDSIRSVGSTSKEWILKTFTSDYREQINETAYLTANSWASEALAADANPLLYPSAGDTVVSKLGVARRLLRDSGIGMDDFSDFRPLWNDLAERNPYGPTPLPSDVTDYTIAYCREMNPRRLVVHYMQPHDPHLANALDRGNITEIEQRPWDALRNGADADTVRENYVDNLRLVLDELSRLLQNAAFETVAITADHGELLGEMGLFSHGAAIPHPAVKRVPWVTCSATDTETVTPEIDTTDADETSEEEVINHLKQLGYI